MDGVISLLNVKKGERVVGNSMMAGTEMMRVADMNLIEVQVDVSENDIPKVKLYDSALVEIEAYNNRKFKGIVTQIASSNTGMGTQASASANDVTNYKVHIRLLPESYSNLIGAGKGFPFRPGMSANADIQTRTRQNVLSVALNAVTTRDKNSDKAPGDNKGADKKPETSDAPKSTSSDDGIEEVVFVLQADKKVKKVKVKTRKN
jgi:HlyD family secretion protein